uniref:Uncharacterized protein n=1 Tax=Vespula pensylvanica TaxID=30213 RepID=A0A834U9P6_VESPE|nr:hypothetical protein H0235_007537 [Vespula pensylvanica]
MAAPGSSSEPIGSADASGDSHANATPPLLYSPSSRRQRDDKEIEEEGKEKVREKSRVDAIEEVSGASALSEDRGPRMSCNNGALKRSESLSHRNGQSPSAASQLSRGKTIKRDARMLSRIRPTSPGRTKGTASSSN